MKHRGIDMGSNLNSSVTMLVVLLFLASGLGPVLGSETRNTSIGIVSASAMSDQGVHFQAQSTVPVDLLSRLLASIETSMKSTTQRIDPLSKVIISGRVLGKDGKAPVYGLVIAVHLNFTLANYTMIDKSGYYNLSVDASTSYYLVVFTASGTSVDGYGLHGYVPTGRRVNVGASGLTENFSLEPAFDVIIENYDMNGKVQSNDNFTSQKFAMDLNDSTALSIFADTDKGAPPKIPSLIVPVGQPRKLFVNHEVRGFGRVMLRADNDTKGYSMPKPDGMVLNLNYELARTRFRMFNDTYHQYLKDGYSISKNVTDLLASSKGKLDEAAMKTGAEKAGISDVSLNCSLWGSEHLTMERAQQDIQKYRTGKLIVNVRDMKGDPVPLADVHLSVNQTSRDFDFGIFDTIDPVGNSTFEKFMQMGGNYATEGFYWSISEPQPNAYSWDFLNYSIGVLPLKERGFKLKAHALCYLLDLVEPNWVKTLNYTELNKTVYRHVSTLAKTYKNYISVWEASNEAHGTGANHGLDRAHMLEIIRTSERAIHDSVPGAFVTVNSAFDWFGQSRMGTYLIGGDNYTYTIPEYLDTLISHGIKLDGIEQQMYDGGHSDFANLWHTDVPTFDMFELSMIGDRLGSYGKPVRIAEQSVSGTWNESWKEAGYLHQKWNPESQADFVRMFYTLMFSKKNLRGITWWNAGDLNAFMLNGGWFDEKLNPKPALYAFNELVKNWTTKIDASFNGSAPKTFTVFAGDQTINLTYTLPGNSKQMSNYTYHIGEGQSLWLNITVDNGSIDRMPAELQVVELTSSDPNPVEGDNVTVSAKLRNNGPADKKGVDVTFYVDGARLVTRTEDMPAGKLLQTTANWQVISGKHNITVVIDPERKINDPYRKDNARTLWLTARNKTIERPDLMITSQDIVPSSKSVAEGDAVTFSVKIRNVGSAASVSANVSFYKSDPDLGGVRIGDVKVLPAIEAGKDTTLTSDAWSPPAKGNYLIFVRVDGTDPAESNTSNNKASIEITVEEGLRREASPLPDYSLAIAAAVVVSIIVILAFFILRKRKGRPKSEDIEQQPQLTFEKDAH